MPKAGIFSILIFSALLLSCESKLKEAQTNSEVKASISADLELSPIAEIPDEIDGCACYFSRNDQELKDEKYIYVNDFAEASFISVNGELIRLKLKRHSDSLAKEKFYIYNNSRFELKIEIRKETDIAEELTRMEGQLILKELNNGQTKNFPFVGECGC